MNVAQTRGLKAATGDGGTAHGPGKAPLPLQIRLGWGLGSMPITILNLSSNVLLLRFMTDSLGIAAVVAGLIFAGAKVWDAVTDPLMGVLSDRITTPWGRRLPWLASGGLLCALTVVALYTTPDLNGMALLIYLAAMLLLFRTAYTMFNIPYIAMAVELTPSYHERTQLMSFRVVFSSFGSLIGLSLGPAMLAWWGATRAGHARMAWVLAGIAVVSFVVCIWSLRQAPQTTQQLQQPPLKEQFRSALENVPFLWLMASKMLYFLTLAVSVSTTAYFTKHVLEASDELLGIYLGFMSVVLILSQPAWLFAARRLGKRNGYVIAAALYGFAHFSWWFAGPGEPTGLVLLRSAFIGLAGGGTFLLTQAMLPDALEFDHLRTGLRREGAFTGLYVLVEKLSGALGVAFVGVLLGAMGYIEATEGQRVEQTESALLGLYLCIAVLPLALQAISIAAIARYNLSEQELERLRSVAKRKPA